MRRYSQLGGLRDGAEGWQPPDPDDVEDEIRGTPARSSTEPRVPGLLAYWTETVLDACWFHTDLVARDVSEIDRLRRTQILQLSRHGRFGGADIHAWDDEPVAELQAWHEALVEMMGNENAATRAIEGMG